MSPKSEEMSSWDSFADAKSTFSEAEILFEQRKRSIGFILGPLLFFILLIMPITGLEGNVAAQRILAITAWILTWWITEPIPIPMTSILTWILVICFGVMNANDAYALLGVNTNWVMIGAFIIVAGVTRHGLAQRLALKILSFDWVAKSPTTLIAGFAGAVAILSAFMANIPIAILFLSIAFGIGKSLQLDKRDSLNQNLIISCAYASQSGGVVTPIGATAPNFLMITLIASLLGFQLTFTDWVLFGLPVGILLYVILIVYFRYFFKLGAEDISRAVEYAKEESRKLGPLSRGEKNAAFIFLLALVLWFGPSILGVFLGTEHTVAAFLSKHFTTPIVALIGAMLLFVLPVDWKEREFTLNWNEAGKSINWGVILLVSAGLVIGNGMNSSGLLDIMVGGLINYIGGAPPLLVALIISTITVLFSLVLPNVPLIGLMIPLSIPVAVAVGANPIALAITVGLSAQQSYAMPISAGQMAIVYGTGVLRITEFFRCGFWLSMIYIPVMAFIVYPLCSLLFPM